MITLHGVSKAHGSSVLFTDVSMQLVPGRRVALVGGNGAGKTTLLEIALGIQQPDSGQATQARGVRSGYLPQDLTETATGTVLEETLAGAIEVQAVGARLAELQARLDDGDNSALEDFGRLQDRFATLGGYTLEADAHRVLAGLGFAPEDADRPLGEMSGGWRVRVALARLLLDRPDILVLDEPTNHLDLESIAWLEQALAAWEGAILFVSHDRDFIDAVAERVVELGAGTATEYVATPGPLGAYDQFVEQREERLASLRAQKATQDRQIAAQELFITRFRAKATKARQVQSRVKALEKMERIELPEYREVRARFGFPDPPRAGRVVVEFDGVTVGYDDDPPVLTDVSLVVERGRKVGVIGPNGAGKSTLLHLLTGRLEPRAGTATLGHNVQVAQFAQHQVDVLNLDRTVLEEFSAVLGEEHRGRNVRTMLGAFGFSGDAADRRVAVLSGGERTRLALARVMANPVNLLILDEPTNHLDIPSRDILVDALQAYPGTIVLVTHDRHVIRNIADMVVDVRGGRVTVTDGPWEERKVVEATTGQRGTAAADRDERVARRRQDAAFRAAMQQETGTLRREVERLERDVTLAEGAVAELTRRLADPAIYDDPAQARKVALAHGHAKDRAKALMADWEARLVALDAAEARVQETFDG